MKCIYPIKLTSIWHLWIHTIETNSYELYNLKYDISETKNLNDSEPVVFATLKNELESWKKKMGAQMPTRKNVVK